MASSNGNPETKNTLWIVDIEPIEKRYTAHWQKHFPRQFSLNCGHKFNIIQISGHIPEDDTTKGGFLNFAGTTDYKSQQAQKIARLFADSKVHNGDVFLYTDYWNPTVFNTKYTAELNGVNIKLFGICHAGVWDPADILSKKLSMGWPWKLEKAFDEVYDSLFFATEFSRSLYEIGHNENIDKNEVFGFPMEYYDEELTLYWKLDNRPVKEDIVVFPHRISSEKNHELFLVLKNLLPEYEFITTSEVTKNKKEYYDLMLRSKLCFSASLQETLGISCFEALRCGVRPLIPDRLSYSTMLYDKSFYYPWHIANTEEAHKDKFSIDYLVWRIKEDMNDWELEPIIQSHDRIFMENFNGLKLYNFINCQQFTG